MHLTVSQNGAPAGSVYSGFYPEVILSAQYSLTNLTTVGAHLEVDICNPGLGGGAAAGSVTIATLTTCGDGQGGPTGTTLISPSISTSGSSQGSTGLYAFTSQAATVTIPSGTQWTIPIRLVLDDSAHTVLATDTQTVTVLSSTHPSLLKQFVSATAATEPHGTRQGTNVTWRVTPLNDYTYASYYESGTTTVTDPVAPGALYVSGVKEGTSTHVAGWPSLDTAQVNSGFTITPADTNNPASVTTVTFTINNLITGSPYFTGGVGALITYWYPSGLTLTTNNAHASFPDGAQKDASAQYFFNTGPGYAQLSKTHRCPRPQYVFSAFYNVTAHFPNLNDNTGCAWAPEEPLEYEIDVNAYDQNGQPYQMVNAAITDILPPEVDFAGNITVQSGWSVGFSSDPSCDNNTTSWTPLTGPSQYSQVRCLNFSKPGTSTSYAQFQYAVRLNASNQSSLNARPGAYQFVMNKAYLTGQFSNVYGSAAGGGNTPDGSTTLRSTFWNSRRPDGTISPTSLNLSIGDTSYLYGQAPFDTYRLIDSFLGFDNLSFGATLPLELDLTGPVIPHPSLTDYELEDGSGNKVTPTCEWHPQVRSGGTVSAAWYQCTFPGHVPSTRKGYNPFTDCSGPMFCTDHSTTTVGGDTVWNNYYFLVPFKVVAGTQGETVNFNLDIWADSGTVNPPDVLPDGTSKQNPTVVSSYVFLGGNSELTVKTQAETSQVLVGSPATFDVSFRNSGTIATQNTYVYDLFDTDATQQQPISSSYPLYNCTAQPSIFAGAVQSAGSPPVDIEYTTTTNPQASDSGATWTATPPSPLSSATGVRFRLNSSYSATPGVFGPADGQGTVQLTFIAPNDPGARICTMGSIVASGFLPAGAIDAQAPISIVTEIHDPPNPAFSVTASQGNVCGGVTLDASASTNSASFVWAEGQNALGTGAQLTTTLPLGTHIITLYATSQYGAQASVTQTINVTDAQGPVISCQQGPVYAHLDGCTADVNVTASAVDACDGAVQATCGNIQPGDGFVTCSATDSAGNTSTCQVETHATGGPTTAPSIDVDTSSLFTSPNGGICAGTFDVQLTWNPGCASTDNPQLGATFTSSNGTEIPFQLSRGPYVWSNGDGSYTVFGTFNTTDENGNTPPAGTTIKVTLDSGDGQHLSQVIAPSTLIETCTCAMLRFPGNGTVVFEDLHPSNGDFDFNDQVVTFDYEALVDANYNTEKLKLTFNDLAIGASIHSALYVALPGVLPQNIVKVDRYFSDGSHDTVQPVPGENTKAVLPIIDDTFHLYGQSSGFINTDPSKPMQTGKAVALVVTLTNNPDDWSDPQNIYFYDSLWNAPYDVFITRANEYGRQIHQAEYGPTDLGLDDLRNTMDDASGTNGWGNYVNSHGIPFAIMYFSFPSYWPQEGVDMTQVFTGLVPWIESNYNDYNYYSWYYRTDLINTSRAIQAPSPIYVDDFGPLFESNYAACYGGGGD
ncbi:MAG: LruC domain-containing protein [Deltaproteobacteria bacterium]|nr:LruC domain-containing protein [Deltaproteobacteria bacterium]